MPNKNQTSDESRSAESEQGSALPPALHDQNNPGTDQAEETNCEAGRACGEIHCAPPRRRCRFLTCLEEWNPLLRHLVPSIFSILLIVVVIFQAIIYDEQRKNSINAERGNVMLKEFTVYGIKEIAEGKSKDLKLDYVMKNYGRTPAWTKDITFKLWLYPNPKWGERPNLPKTRPLVYEQPKSTTGAIYLVPPGETFESEKFQVILSHPLTKEEAEGVMAPCEDWEDVPKCKQYLFVYGYIEYTDVFHKSHTSHFAYLYYFRDGKAILLPVGFPEHWDYD